MTRAARAFSAFATSTLAAVAIAMLAPAYGKDLTGVYEDALRNDPQLREADATRLAAREANPQAWSALLPQLNGDYAISRQHQAQETVQPIATPGGQLLPLPFSINSTADSHGYQLQLRQSVFSWANWSTLSRAHKQVAQAETDYHSAEQTLIQRVAQAYFNVLAAQDTLDANASALEAISRQLDQANKRFEVGLIAITDVKETQASRDSAAAAVIDAKRQLASQQQALREITDQDYPALSKPGETMPLVPPSPADPERWVSTSMDQNLTLVSSRLAADIARENVSIARAGHLPTLDLTGSMAQTNSNNDQSYDFGSGPASLSYPSLSQSRQIQLQITVPLFTGGLTQSQVRQSQYNWIAAKDRMQRVSRQTEHQARDAYFGLVSEVAHVNALRQGLDSSQTALKATEAGYEVGTRTAVEVLQSRQALVQAQTSYAQARYNYLLDLIQLRLAAGSLDRKTVEEINQWLTVTQAMSTSPVTEPTPGVAPQP